ncbi:MAG: hypothetical protein KGQ54_00175 [Verrucomicrobia bacterium]|nr:hypothetical protein [Verrucomicrobiota bacterium]
MDFSLNIKTTGSRSSVEKPRSDSRHLYAGYHLRSVQVTRRFVLGYAKDPSFDITFA